MSAHDTWIKSIKFVLDNWGKIIIVLTAIAGYITGGVQYVDKVEKVNENANLIARLEALEMGPKQPVTVVIPKQTPKGLTSRQCKIIVDSAIEAHIKSRLH